MSQTIVNLESLSKDFFQLRWRLRFHKAVRKGFTADSMTRTTKALQDVTFSVTKGDNLAILGHNGAGKSTLLRLIAGIFKPTQGKVSVKETPVCMFNYIPTLGSELPLVENIRIFSAINGVSPIKDPDTHNEILHFAGLEDKRNNFFKELSTGQIQRFILSVYLHCETDFYIFDESLSNVDIAFQNKCSVKFEDIKNSDQKTLLIASHDMEFLKTYCSEAILLENGRLKLKSDINSAVSSYTSR